MSEHLTRLADDARHPGDEHQPVKEPSHGTFSGTADNETFVATTH